MNRNKTGQKFIMIIVFVVYVDILSQMKCFVLNKMRFSQTDCVADFVKGNIDMATMEKKNTFPLHQVRTYSCTKDYNVTFWSTYFGQQQQQQQNFI